MKRFTVMFVVFTSILTLSTYAEDRQHTISVLGKAEENVKPDSAYVTLYAQTNGILMVDAVRKADKLVEEITSAVLSESNVVKTISVSDVALGEKITERWRPDQKEEAPCPQVVRRILVTCKPLPDGIYQVIDKAIRAGALMQIPSRISYPEDIRSVVVYGLEQSTDTELIDRIRKAALNNAKAEAEKTARLAGKKVGDVVSIGYLGITPRAIPMRVMGMQSQFPTEYIGTNQNEITISHSISVTFELKE
jgi:uncharacterized protein YggE